MPKILIVIGPESSGTRIISSILAQHPDIAGHPKMMKHYDLLGKVWSGNGDALTQLPKTKYVLTRRSLPHGKPGKGSAFMGFPDLLTFCNLCKDKGLQVMVLITVRSPLANFASWFRKRASHGGNRGKIRHQYRQAYRHIFEAINTADVDYLILSLEALLLDKQLYVRSIFQLLGLSSHHVNTKLNPMVNVDRYAQWGK